eukprot:TRINITY_DN4853_c0_g1_i1.p1 TRINITY_DN4853_c0_g1~~TRINITY_DN4853_c0_g1_i1.p1  ORF type:complete len:247 (-),score=53.19 TRINITY_DN4853_c0_g1_i1:178-918(-)
MFFFFFSSRRRHTRSSTVSWAREMCIRDSCALRGVSTKTGSILYYRQYFDVDTEDVKARVLKALRPMSDTFIEDVAPNPDMYGPFWISATLVFVTAAAGNFASYLSHDHTQVQQVWAYDFRKVTQAALLIWGYITLVPFLVYSYLWYRTEVIDLLLLVCLWGYSLVIFIPTAAVCMAPSEMIRWLAVMGAFAFSSAVLTGNLRGKLKDRLPEGNSADSLLGGVLFVNFLVCIVFKVYFFEFATITT